MAPEQSAAELHRPVLLERVVDLLSPALAHPGAIHVDATLGLGGHAEAILERVPEARVIGIDRDEQALAAARTRLHRYADRVQLEHHRYDEVGEILARLGIHTVDTVLFDLGVSSLQLDRPERGFAYRFDAPLDMRMDQSGGPTAADVLNTYPEDRLSRTISEYGEERHARRIARAVVAARAQAPFETSRRLVEVVERALPAAGRRSGHPAKRIFQALRIEVNAELEAWRRALPAAVDALRVGGRIVVLSYHSLEDRIAKRVLGAGARSATPAELPVELPEHAAYLRLLTRGAEQAGEAEIEANPRAASVRLRAAERIRARGGTTG